MKIMWTHQFQIVILINALFQSGKCKQKSRSEYLTPTLVSQFSQEVRNAIWVSAHLLPPNEFLANLYEIYGRIMQKINLAVAEGSSLRYITQVGHKPGRQIQYIWLLIFRHVVESTSIESEPVYTIQKDPNFSYQNVGKN